LAILIFCFKSFLTSLAVDFGLATVFAKSAVLLTFPESNATSFPSSSTLLLSLEISIEFLRDLIRIYEINPRIRTITHSLPLSSLSPNTCLEIRLNILAALSIPNRCNMAITNT